MRPPQQPLDATGLRIAVVASEFNSEITEALLSGCIKSLGDAGLSDEDLAVHWVPGAFELPLAAQTLAESEEFDAVIALGCVIRGETAHFDLVAGEAARGIMAAMLDTGVPIAFGVLATEDRAQAEDRAGGRHGNSGADAARAAVEMARLIEGIGG